MKNKYYILHIYIPEREIGFTGEKQGDYTYFTIYELKNYFFKCFKKYVEVAKFVKGGKHLGIEFLDYEIIYFETEQQIREHLKKFKITARHETC